MYSSFLSKFTIEESGINWWMGEKRTEIPMTWDLERLDGWILFDHNQQDCVLCKGQWKINIFYYTRTNGSAKIFFLKDGARGYTQMGTFEIKVIESNRKSGNVITREANDTYNLQLYFPPEKDSSESEDDLEEIYELVTKLKKMLKKKLNK